MEEKRPIDLEYALSVVNGVNRGAIVNFLEDNEVNRDKNDALHTYLKECENCFLQWFEDSRYFSLSFLLLKCLETEENDWIVNIQQLRPIIEDYKDDEIKIKDFLYENYEDLSYSFEKEPYVVIVILLLGYLGKDISELILLKFISINGGNLKQITRRRNGCRHRM